MRMENLVEILLKDKASAKTELVRQAKTWKT